jgi:hypothetical protein
MTLTSRIDILPGTGLGNVRLGMRLLQVVVALPEAQIYENWMGGNLNDALLFHGIRLHFDAYDAHSPLSTSRLSLLVIHQRENVYLFDQAIEQWTKDTVLEALNSRAFQSHTLDNGDLQVTPGLTLSFTNDGRLDWVEIEAA